MQLTQIDSPHWTHGGTGVTNFDPKDVGLYGQALSIYGDNKLVISTLPMSNARFGHYSLHDLRTINNKDLSVFWAIHTALDIGVYHEWVRHVYNRYRDTEPLSVINRHWRNTMFANGDRTEHYRRLLGC